MDNGAFNMTKERLDAMTVQELEDFVRKDIIAERCDPEQDALVLYALELMEQRDPITDPEQIQQAWELFLQYSAPKRSPRSLRWLGVAAALCIILLLALTSRPAKPNHRYGRRSCLPEQRLDPANTARTK